MESELFLKLQRTLCRDQFEVVMKTRNAHTEMSRDAFNLKRLVNIFLFERPFLRTFCALSNELDFL
jgi:hypothetical protein